MKINPLTNFAAGPGSVNEGKPIAGRLVSFLGENFYNITVGKSVAKRNDGAIYLYAGALVADFGVNGVGKIDCRSVAGQHHDAALGSEGVDLFGIQIDAQRRHEFAGFLHFLHPLDELAHPDDALIVGGRDCVAVFVFPVSGDALFGDAMHFLRADLHFESLAAVNHRGVERLIQVRPGHGDVILETPRDGRPDLVDDAERGVTVFNAVSDDADGKQIVHLINDALLLLNFQVQRVGALHSRLDLDRNTGLDHFVADRVLNFEQKFIENFLFGG